MANVMIHEANKTVPADMTGSGGALAEGGPCSEGACHGQGDSHISQGEGCIGPQASFSMTIMISTVRLFILLVLMCQITF